MQAVLIQAVVMFLVLAATTAVIALVRRLFTPTTGCCTCPPPPATETATITYAHSRRLWYSAATCRRGGCTRLTWWSLGESPDKHDLLVRRQRHAYQLPDNAQVSQCVRCRYALRLRRSGLAVLVMVGTVVIGCGSPGPAIR